jgi:ABC-2 type transport system permease protein
MNHIRLTAMFIQSSAQEELAYRANFFIHVFHSLLNLASGVLGVGVLFNQINNLAGWNFTSALTLLGVYLLIESLRSLFIGPGFDALMGMEGEIGQGRFDFTLLRPVNTQFFVSFRKWKLFSLFDLALALGVIIYSLAASSQTFDLSRVAMFIFTTLCGLVVLYSVLLIFSSLAFWSPGFFFNWAFDAMFQMARYPVELYPGWLRLILTWVIPVGVMTTIPVKSLTGGLTAGTLFGSLVLAGLLFHLGIRRYGSASS